MEDEKVVSATETETSNGAGSDNNDDVQQTLEAKNKELASVKEALRLERQKHQRASISSPVEETEGKRTNKELEAAANRVYEERAKQERISYEVEVKREFLKRFPAIAADNSIGLADDVVDNYNLLLEGQTRRGNLPRTKEGVSKLLESAVKMSRPDLFVNEIRSREVEGDYEGIERGASRMEENPKDVEPRRNQREQQLHSYINQRVETLKRGRGKV